jgi:hypothetical protein
LNSRISHLKILDKPIEGYLYIADEEISPNSWNTIGCIEVKPYSYDGIERVEFYVDNVLKITDIESPYLWDEFAFG